MVKHVAMHIVYCGILVVLELPIFVIGIIVNEQFKYIYGIFVFIYSNTNNKYCEFQNYIHKTFLYFFITTHKYTHFLNKQLATNRESGLLIFF